MAKSALSFVCQNCGAAYNRWQGKCESCGEWNTLVEEDTTGATDFIRRFHERLGISAEVLIRPSRKNAA